MATFELSMDETLRHDAQEVLANEGLTLSDAVSTVFRTIVNQQRLPIELLTPNAETLAAMREVESGNLQKHDTIEGFMRSLNEDD